MSILVGNNKNHDAEVERTGRNSQKCLSKIIVSVSI